MIDLAKTYWQLLATVAVVGSLMSACALRDRSIEQRGATKAAQTIEKANDQAANRGAAAARKSHGGVRGQRDPSTRNE